MEGKAEMVALSVPWLPLVRPCQLIGLKEGEWRPDAIAQQIAPSKNIACSAQSFARGQS